MRQTVHDSEGRFSLTNNKIQMTQCNNINPKFVIKMLNIMVSVNNG